MSGAPKPTAGVSSSGRPGASTTRRGARRAEGGREAVREGAAAGVLAFGTTALCLVIGAFSLAIAARERRRGSPAWAWVVPGVGGVALLVSCFLRAWWWA